MAPFFIDTRAEYELCKAHGIEPLIDARFTMDIRHPEMAHDPRNVNILSFEMHNRRENGDRRNMRIYRANLLTVEQLKKEYRELR